ncbi:hypothetical protein V0U79_13075 [Hyphobacterium sp. HN65]|uniref:Uncharacterized protein n=1 Tax=Hyphobacterium lacteum TaxID=3116575 RepID=A0ABU7LTP8_9PROT|nr:hypothetical protein [Hyphobacterium sp. HN65]MEE2527292.1 hypothetical protein [Hyphobacterium sp. HN65]
MSSATRFDVLAKAAGRYGDASLDNYALVRSLAERVATGFCRYLGDDRKCVYLVPPEGPFTPVDHGSGAFSVSGQGFLPLGPIRFGLAVRVSDGGDWIRVVISAEKEGPDLDVSIIGGRDFSFRLPVEEARLTEFHDVLFEYLTDWFNDRADHYANGSYGGGEMGFEFIHSDEGDV